MKYKQRTLKSVAIFFSLIIIGLAIFWQWPLFCGPAGQKHHIIHSQSLKLQGYTGLVSMRILAQTDGSQNVYWLELIPLFGRVEKIRLSGFEREIKLFDFVKADQSDYLLFSGAVGAHSENLVVVKIDNQDLSIIRFEKDKQADISLVSNWPKFEIVSIGSLDISALYRDYEKDPLTDNLVERYQLQNGRFEFTK